MLQECYKKQVSNIFIKVFYKKIDLVYNEIMKEIIITASAESIEQVSDLLAIGVDRIYVGELWLLPLLLQLSYVSLVRSEPSSDVCL